MKNPLECKRGEVSKTKLPWRRHAALAERNRLAEERLESQRLMYARERAFHQERIDHYERLANNEIESTKNRGAVMKHRQDSPKMENNSPERSLFLSRITQRLRSRLINFIIFWAVILVMILAQWLDQASA